MAHRDAIFEATESLFSQNRRQLCSTVVLRHDRETPAAVKPGIPRDVGKRGQGHGIVLPGGCFAQCRLQESRSYAPTGMIRMNIDLPYVEIGINYTCHEKSNRSIMVIQCNPEMSTFQGTLQIINAGVVGAKGLRQILRRKHFRCIAFYGG